MNWGSARDGTKCGDSSENAMNGIPRGLGGISSST